MTGASKLVDECVRLALEAESMGARRRLLRMAEAWKQVDELLQDRANNNDALDRMWAVLTRNDLLKTPS
jgi:hypothetical protein